jgi:hypothetical protein
MDPMRHPDVVVVGTGRSGTSFCAYMLQEHLGVCMAHEFHPATKEVLGGYPYAVGAYEELSMLSLTGRFVKNRSWVKVGWLETFSRLHAGCGGLVGIKQWRFAMATPGHWGYIRPRLVVRTFRPEGPTVASMRRYRKPSDFKRWKNFYRSLENNMRRVIDVPEFPFPVVRVDFTERMSEDSFKKLLRPHVEALKGAR